MSQKNLSFGRSTSLALLFFILTGPLTLKTAFAQWRPTGPYGGEAELIRVVPKVRGFVIAGAHNGLLYSSSNGGASWANIPFPGELTGVLHALEVDPRSDGVWYAGIEGDRSWDSGLYKTTDAGKNWKLLPGTKGLAIWSLALWPANPDVMAAGTGDGVFRSLDAGATWKRISPAGDAELRPVVSLAFHPSNRDVVFAGTTHLPWRTENGGASWESIHTGMIDDSDVFSIQVDFHRPTSVFASACSGLYASSDEANHWAKLPTPRAAYRTWFVALDPQHDQVVFAGTTEGLLRSEDGGKAWRVVSTEAVRSIAFDPAVPGRIFFASTSAGLMVSTDGGRTLHESNFGFTNRGFTVLTSARGVLYTTSSFARTGGVYRTNNLGLRWERTGEPMGQEIRVMAASPDEPGVLYAAGYHGLFKSKDAGRTWMENPGPSDPISSLAALQQGRLLAGTAHGLYRSVDGRSWQPAPGAPGNIASLELSSGGIVAALGANHGAFVSMDAGGAWKACGDLSPAAVWYGLSFDSGPEHTALAATSAGLFRSTDGCRSWTRTTAGLSPDTVNVVLFHPTKPGQAFASQDGRIFFSTDAGRHWERLDDMPGGWTWPSALLVLPEAPHRLFALFGRRGVSSEEFEFE